MSDDILLGTRYTPSEYCRRAFYAFSRHWIFLSEHLLNTQTEPDVHSVFRMCTSRRDLHMLIIPFKHLLWTLLVPKVATGHCLLVGVNKSYAITTSETLRMDCIV